VAGSPITTSGTLAITYSGTALPLANGGTGQTTASAAFNALSPITTTGDLIIGNGTNSATRLGIGANTYVLTSNGTTATWAAASGGTSTSIANGTSNVSISSANGAITASTNGTSAFTVDTSQNFQFNSGYGSVATAYGCRAWVNFNGTGTVAIRASGNVSSITDGGVGLYSVNLTNALVDANYAVTTATQPNNYGGAYTGSGFGTVLGDNTASIVRLETRDNANNASDSNTIMAAIFR
jgi:hypothetical protein